MTSSEKDVLLYRSFSSYLHEIFGCRVHKIGLDAGFTCPNRDGTCGVGGCTYCEIESFSHNTKPSGEMLPLRDQLASGIEHMRRRFKAEKFIAYFQAFSGTHGPVARLRETYDVIHEFPDIAGLFISTRPDCLPSGVLELIASYREQYLTWLEIGLQSAHDNTLKRINRGHTVEEFGDAVKRAHGFGLPVCAHVILGLPGEDRQRMMATADYLVSCRVESLKLHCLHVMKGTTLAREWENGQVRLLEREEYVGLVCDFLERMKPDTIIQRLAVDIQGDNLLGPNWCGQGKRQTVSLIEQELVRRGSYQGALFA
jgi:radical SAM protein (TIGR01212 family)